MNWPHARKPKPQHHLLPVQFMPGHVDHEKHPRNIHGSRGPSETCRHKLHGAPSSWIVCSDHALHRPVCKPVGLACLQPLFMLWTFLRAYKYSILDLLIWILLFRIEAFFSIVLYIDEHVKLFLLNDQGSENNFFLKYFT